jgi:hypothetical protein
VLPAIIGVAYFLLTAVAARYSTFRPGLDDSDRVGTYVFSIVIGLPVIVVGLALIARYVVGGT